MVLATHAVQQSIEEYGITGQQKVAIRHSLLQEDDLMIVDTSVPGVGLSCPASC